LQALQCASRGPLISDSLEEDTMTSSALDELSQQHSFAEAQPMKSSGGCTSAMFAVGRYFVAVVSRKSCFIRLSHLWETKTVVSGNAS